MIVKIKFKKECKTDDLFLVNVEHLETFNLDELENKTKGVTLDGK